MDDNQLEIIKEEIDELRNSCDKLDECIDKKNYSNEDEYWEIVNKRNAIIDKIELLNKIYRKTLKSQPSIDRKILFRGRELNTERWVYGHYLQERNGSEYIIDELGYTPINGDDLSQYTELNDINGNKIFENDKVCATKSKFIGVVKMFKGSWIVQNESKNHVKLYDTEQNGEWCIIEKS